MTKVQEFMNMLDSEKDLAFDVETGGHIPGDGAPLDWRRGYVCGYSLSDGETAHYISVRHASGNDIDASFVPMFESNVNEAIKRRKNRLIGHNIKFDYHFGLAHGIDLGKNIEDTMVNEAIINENKRSYNLENTAKGYPGVVGKKGKMLYEHIGNTFNITPDSSSMGHFYRLPGNDPLVIEYGAGDTLSTFQVRQKQRVEIEKQELQTIHELERRLTRVLMKMERRGILIDEQELENVRAKVDDLHMQAYAALPVAHDVDNPIFNPKSRNDLKKYFEYCEIFDWPFTDPTERYPEGQPSFNKKFLKKYEEGLIILEARKYDTFKSMFLDAFTKHINKGVINANFNQAVGEFGGARPGRLSCRDPNMQFVPKRDEFLGKIFRKIFVARPGYIFVELDYSQAEPRLFTHYSGEPTLLSGYNSTPYVDMHQIAADYMGVSREVAKNLNLGMMYVMGVQALAGHLGIDENEARAISNLWHRTFPRVSAFTKIASKRAANRGYVFTILGRRARFSDPRWSYRAANRIVQGGCADILKYKMVEIDNYLEENNLEDEIRMLLSIHDALLFEIKLGNHEHHIANIKKMMEDVNGDPFNLKIPFVAQYKYGKNWSEATYGA
jgi:DNA polymerase-1